MKIANAIRVQVYRKGTVKSTRGTRQPTLSFMFTSSAGEMLLHNFVMLCNRKSIACKIQSHLVYARHSHCRKPGIVYFMCSFN